MKINQRAESEKLDSSRLYRQLLQQGLSQGIKAGASRGTADRQTVSDRFEMLKAGYEQFLQFTDQFDAGASGAGTRQAGGLDRQTANALADQIYRRMLTTKLQAPGEAAQTDDQVSRFVKGKMKDGVKGLVDRYGSQKLAKGHKEETHRRTWGDREMPDDLRDLAKYGKGNTILEGKAEAMRVGELDETWEGDWGDAYAKGHTTLLGAQGRIYQDVGFDDWTLKAEIGAQGKLELAGAHYEVGYNTPTVNIAGHDIGINTKVNLDAEIGARGEIFGKIKLGKENRIQLGAEAFAGASATIQGEAALGDLAAVRGEATAWAGIGAKSELDVGFEDGKLNFDMGLGAALGVGFELDWGFTVDFGEVGEVLYDVGTEISDAVQDVGDAVGDVANDVFDAVGDAAGDVAEAAGDFIDDVGDFFGF